MNFEKKVVIFLNKYESKKIDAVSTLISSVSFLIIFWFMVAGVLIYWDALIGFLISICLVVVFFLHFLISEGVLKGGAKLLKLQRARPYKAYPEEIRGIGRRFSDSSFPSSHLASMVGGFFVLINFYAFLWPYCVLLTLLIGLSRIRNGMHYPSDILAGILLGSLYGYLTLKIVMFFL